MGVGCQVLAHACCELFHARINIAVKSFHDVCDGLALDGLVMRVGTGPNGGASGRIKQF